MKKNQVKRIATIFVLLISATVFALNPGDIAIVGVNSDLPAPDEFTIVVLVDIAAGEQIKMRDRGWDASSAAFTSFGVTMKEQGIEVVASWLVGYGILCH